MRTRARVTWALTAAAAIGAVPAAAQSSLFVGVGFGIGSRGYSAGSLFVGSSIGLGYRHVEPYGIYSATYDGWGYGYRGTRHYHYNRDYCWDRYWSSYWDPWSGWYADCVVFGPYHHSSFRARSWRARYYYPSATYVYVSDPFYPPWGPYWAYDPWDWYWDGYRDGYRDGRFVGWDGYYYGGRVRTVYAAGGHRGVTYVRPSPFAFGATYKEDPRGSVVRTAVRRPTATAATAPAVARVSEPTRAGARPQGRPAIDRMPPGAATPSAATPRAVSPGSSRESPGARSATRPSDRVSGAARATPRAGSAAPTPTTSRSPAVARVPATERAMPERSGARVPSDVAREREPAASRLGGRAPGDVAREPASSRGDAAARPSERLTPRTLTTPERPDATSSTPRGGSSVRSVPEARSSRSPSAGAERPSGETPAQSGRPSASQRPGGSPSAREQPARSAPSRAPTASSRPSPPSEPRAAPQPSRSAAPRSTPSAAPRSGSAPSGSRSGAPARRPGE